ncbi:response regulator, partial [Streptomyces zhihengii]
EESPVDGARQAAATVFGPVENRQKALQSSNAELEDKAELLAQQNRDIEVKNTEIEEARQVLEERAEQLAVSMRYKSEFLANMSHELRTPLNSLLILAKLLADNADANLSPKQVEFAETIHGAGSDLLQLINDILDLSKVEAGKMDVSPTRIALVQLVDYVEATFRPLTAEKGLDFSVRVSPELPATLHTDEQRLLQVLRNLLSNAVKFTDSGAVELVIRPAGTDVPQSIREQLLEAGTLRDADADLIAFSVTDTGIGIAAGKMRVIFEAFKQADGTTSRKYGGTGLGLSISREIARLLGGEIHAASEPGRGSTFTLYLPLHVAEPSAPAYPQLPPGNGAQEPAAAGFEQVVQSSPRQPSAQAGPAALFRRRRKALAAGEGADRVPGEQGEQAGAEAPDERRVFAFDGEKVLIVDDDIRNVFALTSVLEQHGLSVLYAENGREGIEVLEQHDDVTVVLMDIMMPEMDGYATTTAIRRMPQFAGLPIIALTAKAMKGDREKAIESGASDYVTKPVDPDHLLSVMEQWMNGK